MIWIVFAVVLGTAVFKLRRRCRLCRQKQDNFKAWAARLCEDRHTLELQQQELLAALEERDETVRHLQYTQSLPNNEIQRLNNVLDNCKTQILALEKERDRLIGERDAHRRIIVETLIRLGQEYRQKIRT